MRPSTLTFGVLLFVFVVYITVRGQLPAYIALFKRKSAGGTTTSSSSGGGGSFGGAGVSGSWDTSSNTTSNNSFQSSEDTLTSIGNSLETI